MAELVGQMANVIVKAGYGNKSEDAGEIKCLMVVKGQDYDNSQDFLQEAVKDAWAISLPTDDPDFVAKSQDAGIESE